MSQCDQNRLLDKSAFASGCALAVIFLAGWQVVAGASTPERWIAFGLVWLGLGQLLEQVPRLQLLSGSAAAIVAVTGVGYFGVEKMGGELLALVLGALGSIILGIPQTISNRIRLLGLTSSVTLALGFTSIALALFAPVREGGYMTLSLALGFLFQAAPVFRAAWLQGRSPHSPFPAWIPLPVGLSIALGTLQLWEGLVPTLRSPIPELALAGGIIAALLLPFITHFAHESHSRAAECEEARRELELEVRRREEVEWHLRSTQELNEKVIHCNNDCIALLDRKGSIKFINEKGRELIELGEGALEDRSWLNSFTGADFDAAVAAFEDAKQQKQATFHAYWPTLKGTPKWWHVIVSPLNIERGEPERYLVIARDVTERMQVEKALRESEEAFRKIFEEGPIAMLLCGVQMEITKVNNAFCRMLGYSEKELLGQHFSQITWPGDGHEQLDTSNLFDGEMESLQVEQRFITRRKSMVWGHLTMSLIRDPEQRPLFAVAMIENINERKKNEEKLIAYQERLQSLASELSLSEERERRSIATNLHDRIGQTLAFARLKLGTYSQSNNGNGADNQLSEIRALIEQAIVDTRSLTFELSPPVLYELGLVPAVEWLARKFKQEHGLSMRFQDDGQPKPLDEDFRIVLFQAVRELLVNVVKHAHATHAQVLIRRDSDAIRILIEDDGLGFDPATIQVRSDSGSGFGLFNIRERVEYLGGQVKIRSEEGRGTRITLIAPLKLNETGGAG
ncbi:MAG: PAS domain S-box protein [Verrucomicrobiota bacterium]|nr:PAS domain S-box protein [Verrucomicrobiota bacterium]